MLITHLQVRTTQTLQLFGFPMSTRCWGVCFEELCCRPRGAGFPSEWFKFIYPSSKSRMTETSLCTPVQVAYSPLASMNHQWTIKFHDGYPLSMSCCQWNTSHPLFPPSATFCVPCFPLVLIPFTPPMAPNMIFQV